jgi:hypothetical protein
VDADLAQRERMDLDALLYHYFGADDPSVLDTTAFEAGQQRIGIDFGVERDPGRRFALWALMYSLGIAPAPDRAFKDQRERMAAETHARIADRADRP